MLTDSFATVSDKLRNMYNGGQRPHLTDPGNPDLCPVAELHDYFSERETDQLIRENCRTATISCTECKQLAADSIWKELEPIQETRSSFELNPARVDEVLRAGAERANTCVEQTMGMVRRAMGLDRGFRIKPTLFEQIKSNTPGVIVHDLSVRKEWWNLPSVERGIRLRDYWMESMIPVDIRLRKIDSRLYVTQRNKRVFVSTSRETDNRRYIFHVPNKSYEVMVLLAWDCSFKLRAFVVPQKEYRTQWNRVDKTQKEIRFRLIVEGDRYLFWPPESQPIDITAYEGDYSPLL